MGSLYEELAAGYLEKKGLRILEKNYRCRIGEIDLVAEEGRYLVFVEVKYRSSQSFGNPLSAVNRGKQQVISRVAAHYLLTHGKTMDAPCRFDVIGFEGERPVWVRNAFDYIG